ncbi:MAG: hypothetical protein HQL32_06550 [Planctomycetes bacterium]|nr:hypothetical protein [Planctomycetota bacterium]
MSEVIYGNLEREGLELVERGTKYFVRYDAGAHQVAWREDELSSEEAKKLQLGKPEEYEVIIALQARIEATGLNPNIQNWSPTREST